MPNGVRLALIQMRDQGSHTRNVDEAVTQIRTAARDGAQVVCLQELFCGAYPCQQEDHRMFDGAESIPGPTTERLGRIAAETETVIVAPIFERRAPGLYHNSAAVIDADGEIISVYRKMHIPDDPLFYEKFYFTPGDAAAPGDASTPGDTGGFSVAVTRYGRLGIGICWDQWFPESARLLALAGAELLLFPTAIGWIDDEKADFGHGQLDAWVTTLRAHAIANGLWLAAVNRVGVEGRLEFWGNSLVVSPRGEIVARADSAAPAIVTADCRREEIDVVRTHWPFLRDRRVDAYRDLTRRWIDTPPTASRVTQ